MSIEDDIAQIKNRNDKVDADKAWETSGFRKISILIITYIFATIVMWAIGVSEPYINAIIPTLGFFLSTLSLKFAKKYWLNYYYKKSH